MIGRTVVPAMVAATIAALHAPAQATGENAPPRATALRTAMAPASPYVLHLAQLINDYRAGRGLPPLELAPDLSAIAHEHSAQMATQRRLSHEGFRDRFDRTHARLCVENVGFNFPHAEAQLDGWRASPGHHRNLLEPRVAKMGLAMNHSFVTFFACS